MFIRKIKRAIDKHKQVASLSFLETMLMSKKSRDEIREKTSQNCFGKVGISAQFQESAMDESDDLLLKSYIIMMIQ